MLHQFRWLVPRIEKPDKEAYFIITLPQCIRSGFLVPVLHREMQTFGLSVVEPLRALIVRHAEDNTNSSSRLISFLIQAGLVSFLIGIAILPLPKQDHRHFRYVTRVKCTALICINSCFEQMLAKDVKHVGMPTIERLMDLANDATLPMTVHSQALTALQTWKK